LRAMLQLPFPEPHSFPQAGVYFVFLFYPTWGILYYFIFFKNINITKWNNVIFWQPLTVKNTMHMISSHYAKTQTIYLCCFKGTVARDFFTSDSDLEPFSIMGLDSRPHFTKSVCQRRQWHRRSMVSTQRCQLTLVITWTVLVTPLIKEIKLSLSNAWAKTNPVQKDIEILYTVQ
jgi:hypothetical protein